MKKVSLLLISLFGSAALVACNGGGSSGGGAPSGCPNGAAQCGAASVATQYDTQFPSGTDGSLITANNVIIGNGESVALTFGVKNITSPVTVSFASNGGNLQSPLSYTFGDNESSYTIILQTNSAASYNITPSVGVTNMAPVIVSTTSTSMFQLPLGTYNMKSSTLVDLNDCSYINTSQFATMLFVNAPTGQYTCISGSISGQNFAECEADTDANFNPITHRLEEMPLPSSSDSTGGYYFNARWQNNTFTGNDVLGYIPEWGSNNCPGMMQTTKWQYQSSSTLIPYPLPPTPTPNSLAVVKFPFFGINTVK